MYSDDEDKVIVEIQENQQIEIHLNEKLKRDRRISNQPIIDTNVDRTAPVVVSAACLESPKGQFVSITM